MFLKILVAIAAMLNSGGTPGPADPAAAETVLTPPENCREWTDGVTACSRIGTGPISCATDEREGFPRGDVACLRTTSRPPIGLPPPPNCQSYWFRDQHCERKRGGQPACRPILGAEPQPTVCFSYHTGRPFDGTRVQAMVHPWCEEWSDGSQVCNGDGTACRGAKKQWAPFVCQRWNVPDTCKKWTDGTAVWSRETGRIPLYPGFRIFSHHKFVRCME